MPEPPNIEGLPQWLQIGISVIFAGVTLLVAARGYATGHKTDAAPAGSDSQLLEATRQLTAEVISLERALNDHAHYLRDSVDAKRELSMRLRELIDRLERN